MKVKKRDGTLVPVRLDEITDRITNLCWDLDTKVVDPVKVTIEVIEKMNDNISTSQLDTFAAEICHQKSMIHPHFNVLASRLIISDHHKNCKIDADLKFSNVCKLLYSNLDQLGKQSPLISDELYELSQTYSDIIDNMIDNNRDFLFDYFGFKTLYKSYLLKCNGKVIETPQHMWMRVALGIHGKIKTQDGKIYEHDFDLVKETYDLLSQKYFTHATPTLYNSGTKNAQGISCFLLGMDDSLTSIFKTLSDSAQISKWSGGIGIHITDIRGNGSYIRGTGGNSDGLVPMLKVFNDTAKYINQCFASDTIIPTKNGLKRFDQIVIGDKVITGKGTLERVAKVFRTTNVDHLYGITTEHSVEPTWVTGAHPIYCKISENNREYVDVKDLRVGDLVGFSVPNYEADIQEYTKDDCRFYGKLIRNGYIHENEFYLNDTDDDFVKRYLFNAGCKFVDNRIERSNMFKFGKVHLYDHNNKKHIHPSFLYLPIEKALEVVGGIFADCIDSMYEPISNNVTDSVKYILLRSGILNDPDAIRCGDQIFTRITKIEVKKSDEEVYDLETVGPEHTYLTPLGIAHNGGGRRPGSIAIYIEPWHADIRDILECKLNHGDDTRRARDLFYAMWIPDLFMKRVEKDQMWSLMCPSECPGLSEVYGNDFKKLYEKYEAEGKVTATVKARDLFNKIVLSQIETGTPYMLYKDACNLKSNQKNIGTIKSSNLCSEIIEYSDTNKYACCVLASVVLSQYVKDVNGVNIFDHNLLFSVVRTIVRNLNKVIDINYYPVPETRRSNESERPLGIGVQGLADVFFMMKYPYDSKEALKLDKEIFETMYYAALTESVELSKRDGPYPTFQGSPLSKGEFQFDLWEKHSGTKVEHSGRWDWEAMRSDVIKYGVRNSLMLALMPTASTCQIMGSTSESFEPITSNAYTRRTLAGEFILINKYMANDLIKLGLWDENMRNNLLAGRGSLKGIKKIPEDVKKVYKTVWELKQKVLIDHSAARGIYIDQSQSLNLYFEDASYDSITKAHFYGWKQGLKTGSYYIRSQPGVKSATFTYESDKEDHVDKSDTETDKKPKRKKKEEVEKQVVFDQEEGCEMCGS